MVEFDLGKPADNALEFLVQRASAIEHYAGVEQSLGGLLSDLLGTDEERGGIVFFRTASTPEPRLNHSGRYLDVRDACLLVVGLR